MPSPPARLLKRIKCTKRKEENNYVDLIKRLKDLIQRNLILFNLFFVISFMYF